MSLVKSLVAVLLLTACVGFVSEANAAPVIKVMIAGSSAMWQSMAHSSNGTDSR